MEWQLESWSEGEMKCSRGERTLSSIIRVPALTRMHSSDD
jgi:hypothetical protein